MHGQIWTEYGRRANALVSSDVILYNKCMCQHHTEVDMDEIW